MDLFKTFTADEFAGGLESWGWIGLEGRTPLFTSLFGDVFLRGEDGFWWLDTVEGTLSRPWDSADSMKAELGSEEGQDRYLLAGLAWAAEESGLLLAADEVYGFTVPPILGGELGLDNLTTVPFVVALNIAGQVHEQVRDLPPGAPVSGVTID